jgi:Holliday junction resolvase-like predicted endonuclease
MTKSNQRIGKWGEDAVAAYLTARGYEILDLLATIR